MDKTTGITYSMQQSLRKGNTQLFDINVFIWNLNFTGDPVFNLAVLPGASYLTRKSRLARRQSAVASLP